MKHGMDFERIRLLFTELRDYIAKQEDMTSSYSLKQLRNIVMILESDMPDKEKQESVLSTYRSLYMGRAGLTEYYIWDDDYEIRLKLNEPLERVRSELWTIMKPYV
ncbi:MAG: hypothetical protein IJ079_00180 [Lachnospiraceae bacterium]|nr:hypothetical protein [Lachnospiraceae bacterium]MBQ8981981.1 hypothetical protein [Lachnospiraceae bacterium]